MAAALRCLASAATRSLIRPLGEIKVVTAASATTCFPREIQIRKNHIDYTRIKVQDLNESELTDFEISKDPAEWQFVERILPLSVIPKPKEFKDKAPSGWIPQKSSARDLPYFVQRTKNYMMPVYLRLSYRDERKITHIRKIQGDIWQLERELKEYLESKQKHKTYSKIASFVNEMSGQIKIRGDHVAYVKKYLEDKGL